MLCVPSVLEFLIQSFNRPIMGVFLRYILYTVVAQLLPFPKHACGFGWCCALHQQAARRHRTPTSPEVLSYPKQASLVPKPHLSRIIYFFTFHFNIFWSCFCKQCTLTNLCNYILPGEWKIWNQWAWKGKTASPIKLSRRESRVCTRRLMTKAQHRSQKLQRGDTLHSTNICWASVYPRPVVGAGIKQLLKQKHLKAC